jgi:hypothetical protein
LKLLKLPNLKRKIKIMKKKASQIEMPFFVPSAE